jgi:TPR repeat protein
VNSAFKLGWSYKTGRGVAADPVVALAWFRRCAADGDSICQALIGQAFERGEGTPAHADSARAWYARSAERGVPDAQLALVRLAVESPEGDEDAEAGLLWLDVFAASVPPLTDERLPAWRHALEERVSEPGRQRVRARVDAWIFQQANRTIHGMAE